MSSQKKTVIRRYIAVLSALVTVATLVSTYIIFQKAKNYYIQLNTTKLDPFGLSQFKIPAEPKKPVIIFYGDSRAAQWSEPDWLAGRSLNLGVGGQTTEQILGRFEHHLAPFDPDIVVFQAGINDLKTIPLFPDSEGQIINNCKRNIDQIVILCRQKKIHVILTTIFPVGKLPLQRRPFWSDRVDPAIDSVNTYIQSLESSDVTILVTADLLNGEDGRLNSNYSRDFLHLNDAGVATLNLALHDLTEPILISKSKK